MAACVNIHCKICRDSGMVSKKWVVTSNYGSTYIYIIYTTYIYYIAGLVTSD